MRNGQRTGALFLLILASVVPRAAAAAPAGTGPLIWSDEFTGSTIDNAKWRINEPGTWGGVENTATAASVGNGALKIATYSTSPNAHKSAVFGTQDTALFKFGYFEARIQFNTKPGQWSAFWMMSPTINTAANDPANAGTEIDIVEHRATNDSGENRLSHMYTNVHWGGYGANHQQMGELAGPMTGLGNGSWHTYGLLWTPTSYKFYYDDQLVRTITTSVSQRSEYLLLSSEVENNSWAGNVPSGGYGTLATSTTNMLVDYVHVYAVPEPQIAVILMGALLCATRRRRTT